MVGHDVRDLKTSDFRCQTTLGAFVDRKASRVLMDAHGRKIEDFKDSLELLYGVYDVLVAHFASYGNNILHRNITNESVLLGSKDAEVGLRGILLDFQAALNFHPEKGDETISTEPRLGTRFFQSCIILKFLTELSVGEAPPHDHMDELESVFNLMCHLFFQFHPNGKKRSTKDRAMLIVRGWDSDKPEDALMSKLFLFNPALGQKEVAIEIVSDSWGPACGALFEQFLEWVWDIQQRKGAILQERRKQQRETERQERIKKEEEEKRKKIDKQADAKGSADDADVENRADREEAKVADEQHGIAGRVEVSADTNPTRVVLLVDDDDSPLVDEDELEEVLDLVDTPAPDGRENIAFKNGIFAALMENGMAAHHYNTVINFFIMAITKIELSLDQHGPPPVSTSRPPKRKQAFNHEELERVTKKLRRALESP